MGRLILKRLSQPGELKSLMLEMVQYRVAYAAVPERLLEGLTEAA